MLDVVLDVEAPGARTRRRRQDPDRFEAAPQAAADAVPGLAASDRLASHSGAVEAEVCEESDLESCCEDGDEGLVFDLLGARVGRTHTLVELGPAVVFRSRFVVSFDVATWVAVLGAWEPSTLSWCAANALCVYARCSFARRRRCWWRPRGRCSAGRGQGASRDRGARGSIVSGSLQFRRPCPGAGSCGCRWGASSTRRGSAPQPSRRQ